MKDKAVNKKKEEYETPLQELSILIQRLEDGIVQARRTYRRRRIEQERKVLEATRGAASSSPSRLGLTRYLASYRRRSIPSAATATTTTTTPNQTAPADEDNVNGNDNNEEEDDDNQDGDSTATPDAKKKESPSSSLPPPSASFVDMESSEQMVEDLRRIAELVVIGENRMTTMMTSSTSEQPKEPNEDITNAAPEEAAAAVVAVADNHSQHLFDLFFEQKTLETIVNMLLGNAFDLAKHDKEDSKADADKSNKNSNTAKDKKNAPEITLSPDNDNKTLLPPLTVATQAIQSISILIQNVSRASSLYILLSSNNINKMIGLPLDLYAMAERERQVIKERTTTAQAFASPPMTELITHFVTFLKSLALRMNTQTLQFFLKFPNMDTLEDGDQVSSSYFIENSEGGTRLLHDDDDNDNEKLKNDVSNSGRSHSDESSSFATIKQLRCQKLEFPLYERALEFCAAHQDSFVRVTAMNICLNTLRLTTVCEEEEDDDNDDDDDHDNAGEGNPDAPFSSLSKSSAASSSSQQVPDGVLHTAKALPFRERFLIAQFACIPSRVERLIAPIFTKLAERWNSLDEQIREIDKNKSQVAFNTLDVRGSKNEKVARAKEKVRRERLLRAFQDRAADLQDELLLLDDVFRVGLTVLNEQLIEMMFATFVYPLLLQPLLLYYQRLSPALEQTRSSFSDHPFGGYDGDVKRVEEMVATASGPAKTALFTLASVFQFLSNRALLRLMYTTLFHPLSPDSTSVPTVRSRLEVSTVDYRGRRKIRLDPVQLESELIPNDRATYEFGTDPRNRRRSKTKLTPEEEDDETCEKCVFVLAPALAEVLEYRGQDFGLIARAKPNPYRLALLQCLKVPDDFSDMRNLAVCVFDSALKLFDGAFVAQILFGIDLKTFEDDVPQDERTLDSTIAHSSDDRGIGGSVAYESRQSVGRKAGQSVGSDLVSEAVNALCSCVVFASRVEGRDEWELGYNEYAAHALFCAIRRNARAMVVASKTIEQRWRQATSLVTARVSSILSPMGGSSIVIRGSPSINDPRYDEKIFNAILDIILYGSLEYSDTVPAVEDLLCLPPEYESISATTNGYFTSVASEHTFGDLCNQIGSFLAAPKSDGITRSKEYKTLLLKREGFCCLFKVDALLALLRDLAATAGLAIREKKLASLIVSGDGSSKHIEMMNAEMARKMYCALSSKAVKGFFGTETNTELAEPGSLIDLAYKAVVPCVSQVPPGFAHLFTGTGAGVEAEGVTWQSLCLFVEDGLLVFAQPLPGEQPGTMGRVITSCPIDRIWVEQDNTADPESPARRLILSHSWFDAQPPPLFLFDSLPEAEKRDPFLQSKVWTSQFDVWFEDQEAAGNAFLILVSEIFNAKSNRGQRIQEVLSF